MEIKALALKLFKKQDNKMGEILVLLQQSTAAVPDMASTIDKKILLVQSNVAYRLTARSLPETSNKVKDT